MRDPGPEEWCDMTDEAALRQAISKFPLLLRFLKVYPNEMPHPAAIDEIRFEYLRILRQRREVTNGLR